ncbi:flagellar hook-length control protein FliK [Bacillaceae bacterium]
MFSQIANFFLERLQQGQRLPLRAGVTEGRLRTLPLFPGQILQGTILKLFPGNTALVQLDEKQVVARLQAPLEAGQTTWLQVVKAAQPVILKMLPETEGRHASAAPAKPTVEGLLSALGLPAKKALAALVERIVQERLPLSKDLLAQLQALGKAGQTESIAGSIAGVHDRPEAWLDIALFLVRKRIPLQRETFLPVERFLRGESLQDLVNKWKAEAETFLNVQAQKMLSPHFRQGMSLEEKPGPIPSSALRSVARSGEETAGGELQTGRTQHGNASLDERQRHTIRRIWDVLENLPGLTREDTASPQQVKDVVARFLQMLGLTHEKELIKEMKSRGRAKPDAGAFVVSAETPGAKTPDATGLSTPNEPNLKGLLLSLLARPETLSQGLRETSERLLQYITGQQLLLADAPLPVSQVTMQIPFHFPDGKRTFFLQIEGRRERSGKIDPEHCRLVFLLALERLGETLIDANVIKKAIALHIYTEREESRELFQGMKRELNEQLSNIGYQLSQYKISISDFSSRRNENGGSAFPAGNPYQGVDIRI